MLKGSGSVEPMMERFLGFWCVLGESVKKVLKRCFLCGGQTGLFDQFDVASTNKCFER